MQSEPPKKLLKRLRAEGHTCLEIGNLTLSLKTGIFTCSISLDGQQVARAVLSGADIDWNVVEAALYPRVRGNG